MTIECVTIATNHEFADNPIASQHRLRYQSIIERQKWDVPEYDQMEYDEYDNPATTYLIWRDSDLIARGVTRLYPTDRAFMLTNHKFAPYINSDIPTGETILEGSRFCIDHTLDTQLRQKIANELVLAYLEHGLNANITHIVGLMYPIYWRNLFYRNNWKPHWLGDEQKTDEGLKARAGYVVVSEQSHDLVRSTLNIHQPVVIYNNHKRESYVNSYT